VPAARRAKKKIEIVNDGAAEGGRIRKPRKRSPRRDEKIEEALAAEKGGRIRKPRKRSPKRDEKIEEALAAEKGGRIRKRKKSTRGGRVRRYHSKKHKYLMEKLTGRGGKLDSPECRRQMFHIMKRYPPQVWNTYINSKVKPGPPQFLNDHIRHAPRPKRADPRAHVIDTGGSLPAITHSINGYLTSHDSQFYHTSESI